MAPRTLPSGLLACRCAWGSGTFTLCPAMTAKLGAAPCNHSTLVTESRHHSRVPPRRSPSTNVISNRLSSSWQLQRASSQECCHNQTPCATACGVGGAHKSTNRTQPKRLSGVKNEIARPDDVTEPVVAALSSGSACPRADQSKWVSQTTARPANLQSPRLRQTVQQRKMRQAQRCLLSKPSVQLLSCS